MPAAFFCAFGKTTAMQPIPMQHTLNIHYYFKENQHVPR